MTLPSEARDGLSRAWLEILKERQPNVSWLLVPGIEQIERQSLLDEGELARSA